MPVVYELFGKPLSKSGALRGRSRHAQCPHMAGKQCDGGGNRDMARWPAANQPLAPFFDVTVGNNSGGYIPCGICSIDVSQEKWAVCPRRLLTLNAERPSPKQAPLLQRIFSLAGFTSGDKIQVWSEVSLRDKASNFNYRLDYVLWTDDRPPVVLEIMTASTSGGNRTKRTDIQSAFCDAVLFAEGTLEALNQSPSVNARQVWSRMASQLIVKSQLANSWGGCAIWAVQDTLINYIRMNTGLQIDKLHSKDWAIGEVNVISSNIDDSEDVKLYAGPTYSTDGSACWSELLHTPGLPKLETLENALQKSEAIAEIVIP